MHYKYGQYKLNLHPIELNLDGSISIGSIRNVSSNIALVMLTKWLTISLVGHFVLRNLNILMLTLFQFSAFVMGATQLYTLLKLVVNVSFKKKKKKKKMWHIDHIY